jgi:asparagine synthase (glutamine-hydrolysing)
MASVLAHRGPNDSGVWVDPQCGLGLAHRRLSILDLSADGHQPMISAGGRHVLVFNGEIYNYRDLRRNVENLGYEFRGHSDTEVMLAVISQWGIDNALRLFNGMFAFALWDRWERVLTLARDRLGEKPLYYGVAGERFVFASELKSIRACVDGLQVSRKALREFVRHCYVPGPDSIYEGIRKLPPGTSLKYRTERPYAEPEPVAYWSAAEAAERGVVDPFRGTASEAVDHLEHLLSEAVRLRMHADVPLGAFLSGGIDSSTVVALMQAHSGRPVKTFSIGFTESGYDEAQHAKAVAGHLGVDHTELYLTAEEGLKVLPRMASIYDEPFGDSSQVPTFLVSQLARERVAVSLSGDGGDELFGGYTRYEKGRRIERRIGWMPASLRRWLASGASAVGGLPGVPQRKYARLVDLLGAASQDGTYRELVSHWGSANSIVLDAPPPPAGLPTAPPTVGDVTRRMMFFDLIHYLPDDILVKVDRASMAVSLESRVPLLDHRVVEFAWTLPLHFFALDGQSKWPLRQVLYRRVPRALVDRPKKGFGIPLGTWLRGPLRDWAEPLLSERRLVADGFFDPRPIRQKWEEHTAGISDWQYHLWDVLMFQAWLDESARQQTPTEVDTVAGICES